MGAPTELSTKIIAQSNGNAFATSRALLKKSQINFFRSSTAGVGFSLSRPISSPHKTLQCVASLKTEVSMDLDSALAGIQTIDPSKTVHVKFQLQQECLFGEHFLLVGDDHILGCWNPLNAVPLNWSDGHLWTVELDMPVGRSIQFKYVLKRGNGEILWQPGPDRTFCAWETESTVTITEDWAKPNAKVQKMTEEKTTGPTEKFIHNIETDFAENMVSADTVAYPEDKLTVNGSELSAMENEIRDKMGASANANVKKGGDGANSKWKAAMTQKKSPRVEPEESIVTYEGGHVLVPGLNPMPVVSASKAPLNES